MHFYERLGHGTLGIVQRRLIALHFCLAHRIELRHRVRHLLQGLGRLLAVVPGGTRLQLHLLPQGS